MAKSKRQEDCPCGLAVPYQQCCGRYVAGNQDAPDALALMRSRYTAYALENEDHIRRTWHPRSRQIVRFDEQERCKWTGLKIIAYHEDGQKATVEFVASYKVNGKAHKLHEVSTFEREDGHWFYVDGSFPDEVTN